MRKPFNITGRWTLIPAIILPLGMAALLVFALTRRESKPQPEIKNAPKAQAPNPIRLPALQRRAPASILPGPERSWSRPKFTLNEENSILMKGQNKPLDERWCDIADNLYSHHFISTFSYQSKEKEAPAVRVYVKAEGTTLAGRLEARGLKPNFAYQMKLRGIFEHLENYETIGFLGRWRLPGRPTNYTDLDYARYPLKNRIEACMLFDYFSTDAEGNAVRLFALDSSMHVLWKHSQSPNARSEDLLPVVIDAGNPTTYERPRQQPTVEFLWGQRELARYPSANHVIRLPPDRYNAELVLTEESFHSLQSHGGYWATVLSCPITFVITKK